MMFRWWKRKVPAEIWAATDIGTVRSSNQDNVYLMEVMRGDEELAHFSCAKKQALPLLFAVCDGMGGGQDGEKASYMAASVLAGISASSLPKLRDEELETFFRQRLQMMNDGVYYAYGSNGNLTGSTVTIFYADKSRVWILNVGDSPCMQMDHGKLKIITCPDNHANQLYQMGIITESERWHHRTKNQLTQYIGMDPEQASLSPHIYKMVYPNLHTVFIVASDGLTDGMTLEEIETAMWQHGDLNPAEKLVKQAMQGGSRDNITAIVVSLEGL